MTESEPTPIALSAFEDVPPPVSITGKVNPFTDIMSTLTKGGQGKAFTIAGPAKENRALDEARLFLRQAAAARDGSAQTKVEELGTGNDTYCRVSFWLVPKITRERKAAEPATPATPETPVDSDPTNGSEQVEETDDVEGDDDAGDVTADPAPKTVTEEPPTPRVSRRR